MTSNAVTEQPPDTLLEIRHVFDNFEAQSNRLRSSYDTLKQNLAESNRTLNTRNRELSAKVDELQQMSSRLHCVLESLTDGVLVVDNELNVERCNPAAESLLDKPKDQVVGKPYSKVINELGNVTMLESATREGRTFLDEPRRCIDENGDTTVVMASASPIRSDDGTVLGAVEVLRNVTELHRLQENVSHQKRMAALGEMAASVAHEIRNPLGTIEGFARLLRRDLEKHPHCLRLASKIVEGVQNLNYVITNLLTYARPMHLQQYEFDSRTLVFEIRDLLADRAVRENVTLTTNVPPSGLLLKGDIRQIRQLLLNLGINALDAVQPLDQSLTAAGNDRKVSISLERVGKRAVYTISDTGSGITPSDLQRIFDPFFTLKEGGTGLGLSLCHKIADAHSGELKVSSTVGEGSAFEVALPL